MGKFVRLRAKCEQLAGVIFGGDAGIQHDVVTGALTFVAQAAEAVFHASGWNQ